MRIDPAALDEAPFCRLKKAPPEQIGRGVGK
jgi:hypothetical protein